MVRYWYPLTHSFTHSHTILSPSLIYFLCAGNTHSYLLTELLFLPLSLQVVGFSLFEVAVFIAVLCITSVLAQTLGLSWLMACFGHKNTIIIGLTLQALQLTIYGI